MHTSLPAPSPPEALPADLCPRCAQQSDMHTSLFPCRLSQNFPRAHPVRRHKTVLTASASVTT